MGPPVSKDPAAVNDEICIMVTPTTNAITIKMITSINCAVQGWHTHRIRVRIDSGYHSAWALGAALYCYVITSIATAVLSN